MKKLVDITLHAIFAGLFAFMCGRAARLGWQAIIEAPTSWERGFGFVLVFGSVVGLIACLKYWPMRERLQHDWHWGGAQSQREWIIPDVAIPFAAGLGVFWNEVAPVLLSMFA